MKYLILQLICVYIHPFRLTINIKISPILIEREARFLRHPEIWRQIGLNIMFLRNQKNLTQMSLADRCKGQSGGCISRNYLQRIEKGRSSCTLDTLIDIAEALEVPLVRLLDFRE